jgi:hypothetical protein
MSLLIFSICLVSFFFIANRAAYRGFFAEDDLDNIANARAAELSYYGKTLLKPMIARDSVFRPIPGLYYFAMARTARLQFTPYVAAIQWIHLINVLLIWLLARTLGASRLGASAAALFFVFPAAVFTVFWRPMYVFDLICATFCLLTLLAYLRGPWLLSIVLFWLALKSKELAIFLPVALLAYEWFFGKRRWIRVAPFFAVSALFGIWALVYNVGRDDAYSLRFTPAAVWSCIQFYAPKLVLGPAWAGIAAILAALLFARNQLVRWGLVTFFSLMLVLLVLPGRIAGAYLYAPFIGLAVAISAMKRPAWIVVFFALWIPWNYRQLRLDRRAELAAADERRGWFMPVAAYLNRHPETNTFVYHDRPETLAVFGVTGALKSLRPPEEPPVVVDAESPEGIAALANPHAVVIAWDRASRTARVPPRQSDVAYIRMDRTAPLWQLGEGWLDINETFRWIGPHATARLNRPMDAKTFEVITYVPGVYLDAVHKGSIAVGLDHVPIGKGALDKDGQAAFRFAIPPGKAGPVDVEFDVAPAMKDPAGGTKVYGIPMIAFGFKP